MEYKSSAFSPSGQNFQRGLINGLIDNEVDLSILTCPPCQLFPRGNQLTSKRRFINYRENINMTIVPSVNLFFFRELTQGIFIFFYVLFWFINTREANKIVIQYGVLTPPVWVLYLLKITCGVKIIPLLYDQGIPPSGYRIGKIKMLLHKLSDVSSKRIIKRFDGAIAINELVQQDYGGNKEFLIIDGGVSVVDETQNSEGLRNSDEFVILLAGTLWSINGVELLLEASKLLQNENFRFCFAGKGYLVPKILEAEKIDSRVSYLGFLNEIDLQKEYRRASVLLNLRIENDSDCKYLFPSKFFELLATGVPVISTDVGEIGKRYNKYCFVIDEPTAEVLASVISEISNQPLDSLLKIGREARDFVVSNKSWVVQSADIKRYLYNLYLE
jgi:glycosyltransferase involved in cell wall biosynthesis